LEVEEKYMRRALQLARCGAGYVSPNPMVGAVIVCDCRIVGEGYHRCFGEGHAEVNAVASVVDKSVLTNSTMYVTLEPCSHYGKTPPCAQLIIDMGIPRVVVGCGDPNERVSGRGIAMLRNAGVEVVSGVLADECEALNARFMTAHKSHRPYVTLKWAQSADGYLDCKRTADDRPVKFSTPLGQQAVHGLRSMYDAILVGSGTALADNPRLDVRMIEGRSPVRVLLDRGGRVSPDANILSDGTVYFCSRERDDLPDGVDCEICDADVDLRQVLYALRRRGITSVLVEGGARILSSFIDSGLWDDARIEVSEMMLGDKGAARMSVPSGELMVSRLDGNVIMDVKNTAPDY